MNKSFQFSKCKLHDKPFNAACFEIYSEDLDDMLRILTLLQNDPTIPPPAYFCLGLKYTSPYL